MMSMWLSPVMFFMVTFFSCNCITALVVGSESAVSRQDRVIFPSSDNDNEMRGFAIFENGILLQDSATSVEYNAVFPISGNISLNGGEFSLSRNVDIENDFLLSTAGCINGNAYTAQFPSALSAIQLPVSHSKLFTFLDAESLGDDVFSLDWNAQGNYLAAGIDWHSGQGLKVLYFDGQTLTVTLSVEIGRDVEAVRWHPSLSYLAYAKDNGGPLTNEVSIRYFDISNGTLGETGGVSTARSTRALAWHPSGNFLLTGEQSNSSTDEIRMYTFNAGSITPLDSINLSPNRHVAFNALSFAPGGNLFAVGTHRVSGSTTLMVYGFVGSTIALDAEENVGTGSFSVDWHPTGTYIAVGLQGSSDRVRIYKHDALTSSLVEATSARVGELRRVSTVTWDSTGNYLATGTRNGASSKFNIYLFDKDTETLTQIKEFTYGNEVKDVRWSRDDCFIATGDNVNNLTVYATKNDQMLFKNVKLCFDSDVLVKDIWKFSGDSSIQLNGHKLIFDNQSKIIISSNSSLAFQQAHLAGVKEESIICLDDSCTVTLDNVFLNLDHEFTFSNGNFYFLNDVVISGTGSFYFTPRISSVVGSQSKLFFRGGLNFYYLPLVAGKSLLEFEDPSSTLVLDTCSLISSRTGLKLSKGLLVIDNHVTFSNNAQNIAEGFEFHNDLSIIMNADSQVDLYGYSRFV